jgi:hypothetical protein
MDLGHRRDCIGMTNNQSLPSLIFFREAAASEAREAAIPLLRNTMREATQIGTA